MEAWTPNERTIHIPSAPEMAALEDEFLATLWAKDSVRWAADRLGVRLSAAQRQILESVSANKHTAVRACHASGKTFAAAVLMLWWGELNEVGDAFIVTTAPTFAQVRAVLWREAQRLHRHAGLSGKISETQWKIDEELIAFGRKPADYNRAAFQGIHAPKVLAVMDEACGISKPLYEAVETITTNDDCRILAIGNPDEPDSEFASVCAPGSGWYTIKISAFDTPNFTAEDVSEEARQGLVSTGWVAERGRRWGEDSMLYSSKVLAEFPDLSDNTLIPAQKIREAQERFNAVPPEGPIQLGVDVANFGSDETVIVARQGMHAQVVKAYRGNRETGQGDLMGTVGEIVRAAERWQAAGANVDSVGVGAGVLSRLWELQNQGVVAFVPCGVNVGLSAGEEVRDKYYNLRAQLFWGVRELFLGDRIAIDPGDDLLATQLGKLRFFLDSSGRIRIETKESMRARGLPSPDRADALALALVNLPEPVEYVSVPIDDGLGYIRHGDESRGPWGYR